MAWPVYSEGWSFERSSEQRGFRASAILDVVRKLFVLKPTRLFRALPPLPLLLPLLPSLPPSPPLVASFVSFFSSRLVLSCGCLVLCLSRVVLSFFVLSYWCSRLVCCCVVSCFVSSCLVLFHPVSPCLVFVSSHTSLFAAGRLLRPIGGSGRPHAGGRLLGRGCQHFAERRHRRGGAPRAGQG